MAEDSQAIKSRLCSCQAELHGLFLFVCADIRPEDEGMYTCVAENPFGKTDASAFVSVTGIGQFCL